MANSLTVSNKAETGPQNYNMRVVECRLAAIVLAIALGQTPSQARSIMTLKQLEPLIAEKVGGPKGEVGPEACVGVVHEHLHEAAYSQEEVEGIIGVKLDVLLEGNASQLRCGDMWGGNMLCVLLHSAHLVMGMYFVCCCCCCCVFDAHTYVHTQHSTHTLTPTHTGYFQWQHSVVVSNCGSVQSMCMVRQHALMHLLLCVMVGRLMKSS